VLANEQVVEGCCWRHEDTPVEQRALEQWFLKITDYADQLLDDMAQLEGGWPERVLTMQRNWIGRSEGTEVDFHLAGAGTPIRVFTTRVDTIYGANCVILAPEHPLNETLLDADLKARAGAGNDGSLHRVRHHREHRRVERAGERRSAAADERARGTARLRQGRHHLPPLGLGHLAAALLGHADPGHPLPRVRRRRGARKSASGDPPRPHRDHRGGALSAG